MEEVSHSENENKIRTASRFGEEGGRFTKEKREKKALLPVLEILSI